MPGPNSAPNGDASLVLDMTPVWCHRHGGNLAKCKSDCVRIRKRDALARANKLRTGKTR